MSTDYAPTQMPAVPAVAPIAAQRRLAQALTTSFDMDPAVAERMARAIVDPADARRRLASPDVQRTSAGELHTISVRVWTPLTSVHPDNKRETADRLLPISGVHLDYPLLPELTSDGDEPQLHLHASDPRQLIAALQKAEVTLESENSLVDGIREEGILRPLTGTGVLVSFQSGDEDRALVSSADGSSRIASSHRILGLSPNDVIYRFGDNDRAFRRFVGDIRQRLEDGDGSADELAGARALIAPADLAIRFVPVGEGSTMARALRALVGLLHVQPPKEWKPASTLDAQGEEVLDELLVAGDLSHDEYRLLAGLMTLDEARASGLVHHHDERAALILQLFVGHDAAARRAIRRVTHLSRIERSRLAKVAAELAVRSFRTGSGETPAQVHRSRVGLQLAYQWPDIWEVTWEPSARTAEQLRDAALVELAAGELGPSQLELAVKGAYHLARSRILAQYSLTVASTRQGLSNLAAPGVLLRRLATTRLGIQTLYQGLRMGRLGLRQFDVIDDDGNPVPDSRGTPRAMSDAWLRTTFVDEEAPEPSPADDVETAEERYVRRQDQIARTVHALDAHLTALVAERDEAGRPLALILGWRPFEVEPLVGKLEAQQRRLNELSFAYRMNHPEEFPDEALAEASPPQEEVTA